MGRDEEIRQIIHVLLRRRQNNPILTGEAGVGKTAVVEGFAQRIASGDVPPALHDVTLRALDIGLLQAGASMKGEFEQRLRQVIDEVQASPKPIILFIDEAHTLIGAGGAAGTGDAANLLKPALARGQLRTIAATTWAEYKKHIESDPALTRRFQVVQVAEPSEPNAVIMMRGVAKTLEKHHKVALIDDALEAAVKLSKRYIPDRQLPDKAVSLLDTACARVAMSQHGVPADVEDARRSIEALTGELELIAREQAIGIDTKGRKAKAEDALAVVKTRLAGLETRWKSEKAMVDRVLAIRTSLRDEGASANREGLLTELRGLEAEIGPATRRRTAHLRDGRFPSGCRHRRRLDGHPHRAHGQERNRDGAQAWPTSRRAGHRPASRPRDDRAPHSNGARRPRKSQQAHRRVSAWRAPRASERPRRRSRWPNRFTAASKTSSPST